MTLQDQDILESERDREFDSSTSLQLQVMRLEVKFDRLEKGYKSAMFTIVAVLVVSLFFR